jgi:hypothetical protein
MHTKYTLLLSKLIGAVARASVADVDLTFEFVHCSQVGNIDWSALGGWVSSSVPPINIRQTILCIFFSPWELL